MNEDVLSVVSFIIGIISLLVGGISLWYCIHIWYDGLSRDVFRLRNEISSNLRSNRPYLIRSDFNVIHDIEQDFNTLNDMCKDTHRYNLKDVTDKLDNIKYKSFEIVRDTISTVYLFREFMGVHSRYNKVMYCKLLSKWLSSKTKLRKELYNSIHKWMYKSISHITPYNITINNLDYLEESFNYIEEYILDVYNNHKNYSGSLPCINNILDVLRDEYLELGNTGIIKYKIHKAKLLSILVHYLCTWKIDLHSVKLGDVLDQIIDNPKVVREVLKKSIKFSEAATIKHNKKLDKQDKLKGDGSRMQIIQNRIDSELWKYERKHKDVLEHTVKAPPGIYFEFDQ